MKKVFCILLMALVMLSPVGPSWAAPGDTVLLDLTTLPGQEPSDMSILSIAAVGDTLYILESRGLYDWKVGDADARLVSETAYTYMIGRENATDKIFIDNLVTDGNVLYGLNARLGIVYRLSVDGGQLSFEKQVQLDTDGLNSDNGALPWINAAHIINGQLYLLVPKNDYTSNRMLKFDLVSGKRGEIAADHVQSFAPYGDSGALALVYTPYTADAQTIKLAVMDLSSGELKTIREFPGALPTGLAYAQQTDTVYFADNGTLFAIAGSNGPTPAAYIKSSSSESTLGALVSPEFYASADYSGVAIRNTDPKYMTDTVIKVANAYENDAHNLFVKENPDVKVLVTDLNNTDDIVTDLVNGSSDTDIYFLQLTSDAYRAIQNRGYAKELSGSAEISNFISRMYPHFASAFLSNGLPIAVPFSLYAKCYGYNLAAFERLGLTEQDVPKTWTEFCDFVANWKQKYADDYPDMSLFGPFYAQEGLASTLFDDMIAEYISYMTYSGTELSFDTPMFRELIAPFGGANWTDSIDTSSVESIKAARMKSVGRDNDSQLFSLWESALIKSYAETRNTRLLPLMLQDDAKSVFTAETFVLVINPYSKNMDAAIRYLEYQAKYLDETTLANLMPDRNDPIRDRYYESNLKQLQDGLSSAQAALEDAPQKDKQAYQSIVDS